MIVRRFRAARSLAVPFCASIVSTACAQVPSVEGEVVLAERDAARPLLVIRVFPDHPDGFDPRRIYKGDAEFGSEVVTVEDVELPYAFRFEREEEPYPGGARWRVLSWLAADPHERWIHPGETFGTETFEFVHVPHGASYADGIVVELGQTAPP